MRQARRVGRAAALALAFAAAAFLAPQTTRAQQSPDAAQPRNAAETRYAQAFVLLSSKFEAATLAHAPPPRRADPQVASALDALADAGGGYGGADFPVRMEFEVCGMANRVTQAYLLHDLQASMRAQGVASPDKMTPQAIARLQDDNLVAFRDETTPLIAFGPRCLAQVVPLVTRFVRSLPGEQMTETRLEGLTRMRVGARDMMFGAASASADERLAQAQRALILDNVVAAAPTLAGTMTPRQRIEAATSLLTLRNAAPDWAKAGLQAMISTLEKPDCEGLCAIGGPAR